MKSTLIFIALALLLGVKAHSHVDNEWLTPSYGAAGDTVIGEVLTQIQDYKTARTLAYAIQGGVKSGDLAVAQEECITYALFSYVKAMYSAEKGRVAALKGQTATAIKEYKRAKAFAEKALTVDHTDSVLGKTSKEIGATFLAKAKTALKKLE